MSEKIYEFLLKLYPDHFRRTYGDEVLRLVADRARSEKGFLLGLRLWLDLLLDLAISLPREYSHTPTAPIVATQPLNGEPSFHLLAERWPNPALLCLGGMLSAVLYWASVLAVAPSAGRSRYYSLLRFRCKGLWRALWLRLDIPTKKNHLFEIQPVIWRPAVTRAFRLGGRVQLLHDRATGHSGQLSTATLCVSLSAARRDRGRTNRWKSREDIQERTASLDSCACVRWRSPVRLASG